MVAGCSTNYHLQLTTYHLPLATVTNLLAWLIHASNAFCESDCGNKRLLRNNVSRTAAGVQAGKNWLVMQRRAQSHPHRQLRCKHPQAFPAQEKPGVFGLFSGYYSVQEEALIGHQTEE